MSYQLYPNDLTDREWEYIKPLIPAAKPGGGKRRTDMRLTLNAIFYLKKRFSRLQRGEQGPYRLTPEQIQQRDE